MKKQNLSLVLDEQEWKMLRTASIFGQLPDVNFYREVNSGLVTFVTKNPKLLCQRLDGIFPWECGAAEIFGLDFLGQ